MLPSPPPTPWLGLIAADFVGEKKGGETGMAEGNPANSMFTRVQ
jgi:hypothetical protein